MDGCFWHGSKQKNNAAFWPKKIQTNKARDRRVNYALRKHDWIVIRIWEHELKKRGEPRLVRRLRKLLAV